MPNLEYNLKWAFVRGYFDGDGSINDIKKSKYGYAKGNIRSNSALMLSKIKEFIKCGSISKNILCLSNKQMMYFLDSIYDNNHYKLTRKYNRYIEWKERGAGGFGSSGK
jgi:hypothetical protein